MEQAMSDQKIELLTASQQLWLNHLQRCEAQGQSLSAYAKAEGLDLKALYNWRFRLKKKGILEDFSSATTPALRFQKVVVATEPVRGGEIRFRWPNGRVLEFDSGVDSGYVKRLIEGLEGIG
jgi:predicted glutamine amidotransferase